MDDSRIGSRRDPSTEKERPLCVAFVLCNEVIEDKRTGNKSLIGLFNGIMAPQLPATHPRMFLMASLTSGMGDWPFGLRITAPSGKELMRMNNVVHFADPLAVHDLVVELRNLVLDEEGVYFADLLLGEAASEMASRRFTVSITPENNPNNPAAFPAPE